MRHWLLLGHLVWSLSIKKQKALCVPLSSARVSKAGHSTDKSDGPLPGAPVQEHPSSQVLGRQNWRHQKHRVSSSISWALTVTFQSYRKHTHLWWAFFKLWSQDGKKKILLALPFGLSEELPVLRIAVHSLEFFSVSSYKTSWGCFLRPLCGHYGRKLRREGYLAPCIPSCSNRWKRIRQWGSSNNPHIR